MKVIFNLALLLSGALLANALPKSVDMTAAMATEPDCPRADRDICLAMNVNPRCVNGNFMNDLPGSCSRCYCSGCTGRCA